MTKIDIFSGFLGAGKTTLIKKLLGEAYAGEKLVLIENEFGEIGIDGGFMQDAGVEVTEMNSGCICCSLVGDFGKALEQVLTTYHPDRILIEPSGVGKLSDIIRAVQNVAAQGMELNGFTTVVDVKKCKMYMKNFGEFFNDQIENAGCIVLSHTDAVPQAKLDEAIALLRAHNATATIVTTPWGQLDGKQLLAAMERRDTIEEELKRLHHEAEHHHHHHDHHEHHHDHECDDPSCSCHHDHEHHDHHEHHHDHDHHEHHHDHECDDPSCSCHHDHEHHDHHEHHHDHDHHEHHHDHECDDPHCSCHHDHDHHHHHHHADEVFVSWGVETTKKFTKAELEEALAALSDAVRFGIVLRAKGIVENAEGGWIHFDYVPGEADVRTGSASVIGRLCVIGSKLDEHELEELFGTHAH